MHKNQLQELAQRSGYNLPSYACIREGPDHAPKFKATATFNGETFDSPGYFSSLRQAEHAAAEVALRVMSERSPSQCIAKILDESGVCKNLLQETAQRAGVPLPGYNTVRSGPGHLPVFTCTVEVAGLQFTGEPSRTKKQAEKNAALAAWTALKRYAGRNYTAPIEDLDVTDEQEQTAIARALSNAYNANAIKSSPAVLAPGMDLAALAGFYVPNGCPAPKGMASAPLYARNRTSACPLQGGAPLQAGAPLYVPRHVGAGMAGVRIREVTVREMSAEQQHMLVPEDSVLSNSMMNNYGAMMLSQQMGQFPRMTQSSPMVDPAPTAAGAAGAPAYVRRTAPAASAGAADAGGVGGIGAGRYVGASVPNFPTQQLLSQTIPSQPGLGLPPSDQHALPAGVTGAGGQSHRPSSLSYKPGMAYQPRTLRPIGQGLSPANILPDSITGSDGDDGMDALGLGISVGGEGASWSRARTLGSPADILRSPAVEVPGSSMWTPEIAGSSRSSPFWPTSVGSASSASASSLAQLGRSASSTSMRGGISGLGGIMREEASSLGGVGEVAARQCRAELEEEDVSAAEATTRQMLSHLCL
ncbi:hypothetical protein CLOP_g7975 [Closterium sp. NIES-67]|nr:hypothetical protein CLOP_g17297 [Closterium sp. NIES-67]GJP77612.1 hypothetical protein CLOP_g7975 [Closterium sp. NIES-67]